MSLRREERTGIRSNRGLRKPCMASAAALCKHHAQMIEEDV